MPLPVPIVPAVALRDWLEPGNQFLHILGGKILAADDPERPIDSIEIGSKSFRRSNGSEYIAQRRHAKSTARSKPCSHRARSGTGG